MAERYEIIFDFSQYAGKTVDLRNLEKVGGIGTDDDYLNTDKIMRFVVGAQVSSPDTSVVPQTLRQVPFPPASTGIDHHFRFHRTNSEWRINGIGFADVNNRVLANVPRGTVEIWELENGSGGWTHPIHIHLVDFRVLARDGNRAVMPYEAEGLKDVVWLGRGETVTVEAHYAPWDGVYMFHCHNLIHEDHDMMAAFNVTALPNFGYNETSYIDPMEPRWRAKPFVLSDLQNRNGPFSDASIQQQVLFMASLNPYSHVEEAEAALKEYWRANGAGNPNAVVVKRDGSPESTRQEVPIPRYRRFQF
jgi:bilirubin oxidase